MSDRDSFAERGKAFENEHFRKREAELIRKLRERAERIEARQGLADATGIEDEAILDELHAAGFDTETIPLVHLVPLVRVAWADGSVSEGEREQILGIARTRGVEEDSGAYSKLTAMLERRPSEDDFDEAQRLIRILRSAAGSHETPAEDLAAYCRQVAEASGGFLGFGAVSEEEQAMIERISRDLERDHAAGARQFLDEKNSQG
jgi:tellurite resistance protein